MEKLEIHPAIIMEVKDEQVLVRLGPAVGGGCGTSCHCGATSLQDTPTGPKIWVKKNQDGLEKGRMVWIEAHLPSTYLSIFLVLLLPVIAIVLGAFIGNSYAMQHELAHPDLISGLCAAFCFIITIFIAFLCDKTLRENREVFQISHDSFVAGVGSCPKLKGIHNLNNHCH